jgi:hypothetical protein
MTASKRPAEQASPWYPRRADPRPAYRMPNGITILGAAVLAVQILFWIYAIAS